MSVGNLHVVTSSPCSFMAEKEVLTNRYWEEIYHAAQQDNQPYCLVAMVFSLMENRQVNVQYYHAPDLFRHIHLIKSFKDPVNGCNISKISYFALRCFEFPSKKLKIVPTPEPIPVKRYLEGEGSVVSFEFEDIEPHDFRVDMFHGFGLAIGSEDKRELAKYYLSDRFEAMARSESDPESKQFLYKEAVTWLWSAAKHGQVEAIKHIAMYTGLVSNYLKTDRVEALRWLRDPAIDGDVEGAEYLECLLRLTDSKD